MVNVRHLWKGFDELKRALGPKSQRHKAVANDCNNLNECNRLVSTVSAKQPDSTIENVQDYARRTFFCVGHQMIKFRYDSPI